MAGSSGGVSGSKSTVWMKTLGPTETWKSLKSDLRAGGEGGWGRGGACDMGGRGRVSLCLLDMTTFSESASISSEVGIQEGNQSNQPPPPAASALAAVLDLLHPLCTRRETGV